MTDETIFTAALEKADPAQRAAFLAEACGDDPERRKRLEGLLLAHARAANFLERPPVAAYDSDHGATQALTGTPVPGGAAAQTTGGANGASDDEPLTFLAPPTRPDALGRLGHYEVLQVFGRGGFGIVFRAFDEMLQRVVALKVMAPQLAATSPARKRFLREARSSAQVRHENVVQVYEVAEQPLPYLAMEFIPGETLQQKLDRVGPLEVPEVLRIGRQIAEGLAAAHATDLIHRDIKPGNVLLEGGQQKVKITDFGLARAADDASISQSGIIAGTPMYMAPEQALGQTLDQRADLFSLGSVLYQMVAGRPPFRANSTLAVLKRVAEDKPRAIREIIPETPQWLCDIIAKLHAKDPDDRYQSAREVADVLADCEAQLKANAKLRDYSRIPRSKPRRSGRRKWVAAAAAVLLPVVALALADIGGVTHLFHDREPGPAANTSLGAKEVQEASAKQLGIPVETVNSIGMKLRLIPSGKFTMGSSNEEIDFWLRQNVGWAKERLPSEGPRHEVEITLPFYMGQTEVTVGQFRQFVKATGYKTQAEREGGANRLTPNEGWKIDANTNWRNPGFAQADDHPVVCVSWDDALEFCNWLSKHEGKTYRLPTEAEWEYGCRAGSKGRWSFGDDESELLDHARILGNSQRHTWSVAGLKANAWGLDDMHGNAWEWCQDWYEMTYYKTSPSKDPLGPGTGRQRVVRGGGWEALPVLCRSAFRDHEDPGYGYYVIGFRVMLVVSPPASVQSESGAKAAKEAQEASAQQLGIPIETVNSIGMKLRFIPPGKFTMGSSKEEIDFWLKQTDERWAKERLPGEGPQHEVEITQAFYMGQTEVTVGQFHRFVKATEYQTQAEREGGAYRFFPNDGWKLDADANWLNPGFKQGDDHPVVCVSWNDAVEFCNWLSKQEEKTYRLPTEAEWEYSCRAGSKGRWSFGDDEGELLNYARIRSNSNTHPWPVAGLKENLWGLHDMHGNVWQWCKDAYDGNYYQTSPPKDPAGPGPDNERVVRGGGWGALPVHCRSAFRDHEGSPSTHIGFRVVLVVSPPAGVRTDNGGRTNPRRQRSLRLPTPTSSASPTCPPPSRSRKCGRC
jgi:formylglycine-generating enzyme required for sulfatase activity